MKKIVSTVVLAFAVSALSAFGQDAAPAQPNTPGKAGHERKHPVPPIIAALDANHDGVIDAQEIANAPAALKTLDKNGDGKLTRDEIRPQRPDGEKPPGMKDGERKGPHRNRQAPEAAPAS